MKPRLMIALLLTLVISASAQEKSSVQTTNTAKARLPQQQPSSTAIRPTQKEAQPGSRDAKGSQRSSDNSGGTIVVDVWSPAASVDADTEEEKPIKLSRGFTVGALTAANKLQSTQRKIEYSIKTGIMLKEFWIQTDLDAIDDSVRLAALAATNEADRQALRQLENQAKAMREWCDWLIDENRHLHLANYLVSPAPLDNDDRFQKTVACTRFLVSMLASGELAEDNSCH